MMVIPKTPSAHCGVSFPNPWLMRWIAVWFSYPPPIILGFHGANWMLFPQGQTPTVIFPKIRWTAFLKDFQKVVRPMSLWWLVIVAGCGLVKCTHWLGMTLIWRTKSLLSPSKSSGSSFPEARKKSKEPTEANTPNPAFGISLRQSVILIAQSIWIVYWLICYGENGTDKCGQLRILLRDTSIIMKIPASESQAIQ